MSLLSVPQVTKGNRAQIALIKADVLALPEVQADSFWTQNGGENIRQVLVDYHSTAGGQRKILTFNFADSTPSDFIWFSEKARSDFQILKIVLIDYDGGRLTINRKKLLASFPNLTAEDISLTLSILETVPFSSLNDYGNLAHWSEGGEAQVVTPGANGIFSKITMALKRDHFRSSATMNSNPSPSFDVNVKVYEFIGGAIGQLIGTSEPINSETFNQYLGGFTFTDSDLVTFNFLSSFSLESGTSYLVVLAPLNTVPTGGSIVVGVADQSYSGGEVYEFDDYLAMINASSWGPGYAIYLKIQ
jgi:hypothetical protein